jgi:hypothetical protein
MFIPLPIDLDVFSLFDKHYKKIGSNKERRFTSKKPTKENIISIDLKLLSCWVLV